MRNPWIAEAEAEVARTTEAMSAFRMEPSAHNLAKMQAEVDHLGPPNAEQRAETRESWRTWFWGGVRMYVAAAAVVLSFGVVGVVCMLLGAANSEVVLETVSEVLR